MQCSTILFINIVFIIVRATESKLISKYEELFYLYLSLQHPWKNRQELFLLSQWWQLWSLLLRWLSNVAISLWPYSFDRNWVPWLLSPPVLLSCQPLLILSLLVLYFNWVFICANTVCICCVCCKIWVHIWLDWLVAFYICINLSSVSSPIGYKALVRPSTNFATRCHWWKYGTCQLSISTSCSKISRGSHQYLVANRRWNWG